MFFWVSFGMMVYSVTNIGIRIESAIIKGICPTEKVELSDKYGVDNLVEKRFIPGHTVCIPEILDMRTRDVRDE